MVEPLKVLLGKAAFSFIGTVSNLGATTMANVPIDDHTAVVRIEHVLHAPPSFARMEGQRITVQLSASEPVPAVGQSLAFFMQGAAFGDAVYDSRLNVTSKFSFVPPEQSSVWLRCDCAGGGAFRTRNKDDIFVVTASVWAVCHGVNLGC
jgi:hypothetical protein